VTGEQDFRKSSFSNMDCVEVRPMTDGSVVLRNSRYPDRVAPAFTQGEWVAFVAGVKAGEFDFEPGIGNQG
jgi:Domain of unknown function (DUF397)